jgi:hypothetical protein
MEHTIVITARVNGNPYDAERRVQEAVSRLELPGRSSVMKCAVLNTWHMKLLGLKWARLTATPERLERYDGA